MNRQESDKRGFRFSDQKLAFQITLIATLLALVILATLVVFAGRYTSDAMTTAAERDFKAEVNGLLRTLDITYELSKETSVSYSAILEKDIGEQLVIDSQQTMRVGEVSAPIVRVGDTIANGNLEVVDQFSDLTDALATIFARSGDDLVRVTTSVRGVDGQRPIGTLLDKDSPAYINLMNGKPFTGRNTLFGTNVMGTYTPVLGADGQVAGALFAGVDLTKTMETLFETVANTRFGENGYAYVVDDSSAEGRGTMVVHPELQGQKIQDIKDGLGQTGTLMPLIEKRSGLYSYTWYDSEGRPDDKFVAFERSAPWGWVVAGGTTRSEITAVGDQLQRFLIVAGIVAAVLLGALLWLAITSRLKPLEHLRGVVRALSEGDDEARARLTTKDEVGVLATAFDRMMDERVATQAAIQRENDQLNASVLALLQAVAQLSQRDLTVKVPVTEDVTGALADALNALTNETGKVLTDVSDISADVTAASLKVKEQADTLMSVAQVERQEVEHTADSLATAASTMNQIAELANVCNAAADKAINTTRQALDAVTDTVGGINSTRDIIRETEKRIKRLGERSQEISGVVNLINTIAERTHILALNASMHAASAGEAGRGFAVVADEVQRLAESARQATAQIATLVNSIQVETADTVNSMSSAIAQVVAGSRMAEQAGEQMQTTQSSTAELVRLVQQIATSSQEQAKVSNLLLERASEIRKSTEQTSRRLEEQTEYTDNLVDYARNLLATVRVFKLPA
ncbi:methyl-accepting chemotaxis protein [Imhoffiella purpurea]|uniref:Putative methyl-accepting chemotaxis sensory transducer n=1 Tax=Imhoffiella purpurea TaxID=1249627 RepID=W9VC01_9GAMM|nr:Cache 3/Cache 2 fusion domain-containing protein [Imhoffiella purpurea]EXJ14501.1 putative methyl-accepting chemotaxis sensory transducer [Imhoffiella purpurea]